MSDDSDERLKPLVISGSNLSHVWGSALSHVVRSSSNDIKPLIVSIGGFDKDGMPREDPDIRSALDEFLRRNKKWSVEIVGFTIFPQRYLQISDGDRYSFFETYKDALQRIKARQPRLNGSGLYFERLIKFGRGKEDENQLDFIIREYLAGRRRTSKFQATIYDPGRDQSKQPYQTFPCLQTVSFVPTEEGLIVNGFYAMQYLIQRAYGNFLGLAHLGAFMAREMGIPLVQVNVMAGVEKLEFPKRKVSELASVVASKL